MKIVALALVIGFLVVSPGPAAAACPGVSFFADSEAGLPCSAADLGLTEDRPNVAFAGAVAGIVVLGGP